MTNQENEIIGGTANHAMAVRDQSSHGINEIRAFLEAYPSDEGNTLSALTSFVIDLDNNQPLYPQNPTQFDNVEIPEAAYEALRKFKRAKTFNLSIEQRLEHMKIMAEDLAAAHDIAIPTISMENCFEENRNASGISGGSNYNRTNHHITMIGKLSIITFLHEFGHALGGNEYFACGYSTKLFKEVYPDQFANLNYHGHMALQI